MTKMNNSFSKSCSFNSIFLSENCLQEDLGDKRLSHYVADILKVFQNKLAWL